MQLLDRQILNPDLDPLSSYSTLMRSTRSNDDRARHQVNHDSSGHDGDDADDDGDGNVVAVLADEREAREGAECVTSTSSEASSALELQHTKVGITFRLATTKPCKISMYWGVPVSELDAMLAPESACTEAAAVESSSALTLATDDDRELAVVVVDPATTPSPSPDVATYEGAASPSPAPAPSITELVPADSHVVRMAAVDESMSDAAGTIARPASFIERLWHQATGWLPRSTASGASGTTASSSSQGTGASLSSGSLHELEEGTLKPPATPPVSNDVAAATAVSDLANDLAFLAPLQCSLRGFSIVYVDGCHA